MPPRKSVTPNGRYTPPKEAEPSPHVETAPPVAQVGPTPIPMNEAKTILYLKQLVGDNAVELAAYRAALDDAMDEVARLKQTVDTLTANLTQEKANA